MASALGPGLDSSDGGMSVTVPAESHRADGQREMGILTSGGLLTQGHSGQSEFVSMQELLAETGELAPAGLFNVFLAGIFRKYSAACRQLKFRRRLRFLEDRSLHLGNTACSLNLYITVPAPQQYVQHAILHHRVMLP